MTLPGRVAAIHRLCARSGFRKLRAVVAGGAERGDSVRNGLATLPATGWVAVHDAARPLLTPGMLSTGLAFCGRVPVTFATPVTDTIKRVTDGRVTATVDRAGLWTVQTPQFFPLSLLRRAHATAASMGVSATDDCGLVERLGIRPRVIPAPGPNIKVTVAADIALVRRLA